MKLFGTDENLSIVFSVDWLIESQADRDDIPYRVVDVDKMIEWLADEMNEKNPMTTNFFNNLFDQAYESGEVWLEGIIYDKIKGE